MTLTWNINVVQINKFNCFNASFFLIVWHIFLFCAFLLLNSLFGVGRTLNSVLNQVIKLVNETNYGTILKLNNEDNFCVFKKHSAEKKCQKTVFAHS